MLYTRLSPDDSSLKSIGFLIHKEVIIAHEAVWHGSTTASVGGTNGDAFDGFEAYYAVGIKKIEFTQGGSQDLKKSSYAIGPALSTTNSCHGTNEEKKDQNLDNSDC